MWEVKNKKKVGGLFGLARCTPPPPAGSHCSRFLISVYLPFKWHALYEILNRLRRGGMSSAVSEWVQAYVTVSGDSRPPDTNISAHSAQQHRAAHSNTTVCVFFFLFHFSFVQLFHGSHCSYDDYNVFSISVDWMFFITLFQLNNT